MLSLREFSESKKFSYSLTQEEKEIALARLNDISTCYSLWKGEVQPDLVSCHHVGFSQEPMFQFDLVSEDSREHLSFTKYYIDPRECIPQQMTCVIQKLKEYIDDNRDEISQCVTYQGRTYCLDHHRIAVQILAGRTKIEVETAPLPDEWFE